MALSGIRCDGVGSEVTRWLPIIYQLTVQAWYDRYLMCMEMCAPVVTDDVNIAVLAQISWRLMKCCFLSVSESINWLFIKKKTQIVDDKRTADKFMGRYIVKLRLSGLGSKSTARFYLYCVCENDVTFFFQQKVLGKLKRFLLLHGLEVNTCGNLIVLHSWIEQSFLF